MRMRTQHKKLLNSHGDSGSDSSELLPLGVSSRVSVDSVLLEPCSLDIDTGLTSWCVRRWVGGRGRNECRD